MIQKKSSSRSTISKGIIKVMGLFTGMQAFIILCSIIKMKLVALWLSSQGVGLFGIYNSTIETISTFTNLGLRQSAVRDISIHSQNASRLEVVIKVVRRWSVIAGLLGAIVISGFAPLFARGLCGIKYYSLFSVCVNLYLDVWIWQDKRKNSTFMGRNH